MSELYCVKDMAAEHIEIVGLMLAARVAETPENYSVTPEFAVQYGSGEKWVLGMQKALIENKVGRFVVVDETDSCIGFATTSSKPDSIRIGNMYTKPAFRSKGLGTLLLEACEARAVADGYKRTTLVVGSMNTGARKLYERYGYEPTNPPTIEAWEIYPGIGGELLVKELNVN